MNHHEELSSFVDGESTAGNAASITAKVLADAESRQRWHDWHLIGDVMRSESLAGGSSSIANKLSATLAAEPIHLPRPAAASKKPLNRRPRLVYGSAIAAAIAFVSVIALAPQMQQTGITGMIAGQFGGAVLATSDQRATPIMLEDPRLRDLLDAHGSMSIRPVSAEVR
jgi:sigma-E factor negative regulatory protein RseA